MSGTYEAMYPEMSVHGVARYSDEMLFLYICRCPSSNYHCISTECHISHHLLGSADVESTSESVHVFPESKD